MRIGVIGGGASGFFAAINCKMLNTKTELVIFEKTSKVLSKVAISGGGRCNVSHHEFNPVIFSKNYPRGEKKLKELLKVFSVENLVNWFENQGVRIKTEEDGRMFPVTDSSQTIIDCFHNLTSSLGIQIQKNSEVKKITPCSKGFEVLSNDKVFYFDKVIVAIGGSPKIESYSLASELGHNIIRPKPSLFTFNVPNWQLAELMGISVDNVIIQLPEIGLRQSGTVLITHWGLSGPAVIKLSAWAAVDLFKANYEYTVRISWIGETNENIVSDLLEKFKDDNKKAKVVNYNPFQLSQRLWAKFCQMSAISDERWSDISKKQFNKLTQNLYNSTFQCKGKTPFKEEFVTAGGVDLKDINMKTMESIKTKGLYFCGEVINVDGVTGGFNFQNAWTTAYIAAMNATAT